MILDLNSRPLSETEQDAVMATALAFNDPFQTTELCELRFVQQRIQYHEYSQSLKKAFDNARRRKSA